MLKVGDKAPDFTGVNQNEETVKLADYKGSNLILYFYPKDDTPGCTKESCSLRDFHGELLEKGYKILGVSADTAAKHQKFIDKYNLPFDLIADTEKEIIKAYDCWGLKKFMGKEYEGIIRTTYIISKEGKISHIFKKVKTASHAEQILEEVEN
ncbi:thioredoxin-dependent thiol peroxidase [Luteibaculum oceani]|uniref:thioredoxin-dependent peroxiredoxin n=2 Tax=Luteibaculum oceani TaxID=1294296 RepID=A0A5C6VFD9_9FLAO|nr:thioredoxin-dependent thiol peroxidase [Luteibaculum oceani]